METIQQLMVAMTFSDGNASVSPKCWHKERGLVSRAVSSGNGHGMHSLTLDDKLCWLENMKSLERIPYLAWLKRV